MSPRDNIIEIPAVHEQHAETCFLTKFITKQFLQEIQHASVQNWSFYSTDSEFMVSVAKVQASICRENKLPQFGRIENCHEWNLCISRSTSGWSKEKQ